MPAALELIHVTDCHLLADPQARLHGWQVEAAFSRILDDARRRFPRADAYVLGGDLVDDESLAGYRRLDEHLAALARPVLAMAGNHDDPQRMTRALAHAGVHQCLRLGAWQLIALDSHVPDRAAGRLGAAQRHRLEQQLTDCTAPTLLFLHHPPCDLDSAWLDAIGLADRAALCALVQRHRHVRALICGHAHQQAARSFAQRPCFVTPATMRQFAPGAPVFTEDPGRAPGYRWLRLGDDGTISTGVQRVAAARQACG